MIPTLTDEQPGTDAGGKDQQGTAAVGAALCALRKTTVQVTA